MIEFFKTQHLTESMVGERIVPKVNYAFIREKRVFTSTVGFASLVPEIEQLSPLILYDLASLTEVLGTTNVFLKLKEEGRLNFTEPLQEFIPESKDDHTRLNHLLTHTSRIRGWIPNRGELAAPDLLKTIIGLPVTDESETKVRYADTNFISLGLVLGKIYGLPAQDVIMQEITLLVKSKGATFHPEASDCVPTACTGQGELLQGIVHDPEARVLGKDCGSADLFSSLEGLIRMTQAYLGLHRDILPLKQDILANLFQIGTPKNIHPHSWGRGLRFDPVDQHPLIYYTGFTGTFILVDCLSQTAMVVLANRIHPSGHNHVFLAVREKIVDTFLEENIYKG